MSTFTYVQSLLLALMPKITATLSIMGGFSIFYEIIRDKSKLSKVSHRIMMMMSLADINVSIWLFMSTWPIPVESNKLWAVGNTQSCSAQGFLIQLFGVIAFLYKSLLGIYYLLQIKYSWRCETFRKPICFCKISTEHLLHLIPWIFGLGTSICGLILKLYNNAGVWCWIASYPSGCHANDNIECTRDATMYRWIFWYGPFWIAVFVCFCCMVSMYLSVREVENNVNKWRPSNQYGNGKSSNSNNGNNDYGGIEQQQQQHRNTATTITMTTKSIATETGIIGGAKGLYEVVSSAAVPPGNNGGGINNDDNNAADDIEQHQQNEIGSSVKTSYQRMKSIQNNRIKSIKAKYNRNMQRSKHSRRVFVQAMFYILTFYLAWAPATFNRLTQAINGKTYYSLALLHTITAPLQGFFNYCIYLRPRILEYHQKYCTRPKRRISSGRPRSSSGGSGGGGGGSSNINNDPRIPSRWQIIIWAVGKSYGREPPPPPPKIYRQPKPIMQQQQQQQQNHHNNNNGATDNNADKDTVGGGAPVLVVEVEATTDNNILSNQEEEETILPPNEQQQEEWSYRSQKKKGRTTWLGMIIKKSKEKIINGGGDDDNDNDNDDSESCVAETASSINSANGAYLSFTQYEIEDENDEEDNSRPVQNHNNDETIPTNDINENDKRRSMKEKLKIAAIKGDN